ncbi:hypothetical protein N7467_010427 [Penicillium canescens]|nr:hypothetical protein N7467_010427 [Penicillium canescens]
MSDDEYYYEYEEDDYQYADEVPELVDDLAASAYHDATGLFLDADSDVEDYFADLEYQSDDYYDNDPTADKGAVREIGTKNAPATTKHQTKKAQPTAAATKTKSPVVLDIKSFQGVIWKTPSLDRDQDVAILYEPHTGEQVALLKNWREEFKHAQPALDKSRLKRRRVEESLAADDASLSEADNEMEPEELEGEGDEPDSSDEMDDSASRDESSLDTGDASNTTPDTDCVHSMKLPSPPKVVIPVKRGRKRKAAPQQDVPSEDTAPPRAKKVESRKGGSDTAKAKGRGGSTGPPVRRSARQKK